MAVALQDFAGIMKKISRVKTKKANKIYFRPSSRLEHETVKLKSFHNKESQVYIKTSFGYIVSLRLKDLNICMCKYVFYNPATALK